MTRSCGPCQACCYVMPTKEIDKLALRPCPNQCPTGCAIYESRPNSCRAWKCAWLEGHEVGRRPNVSKLVVDIVPDFVEIVHDETGEIQKLPVIQVWCDPKFPNAHRDKDFRAWLNVQSQQLGVAAFIRFGSSKGFLLIPPALSGGRWIFKESHSIGVEHTQHEVAAVTGGVVRNLLTGERVP